MKTSRLILCILFSTFFLQLMAQNPLTIGVLENDTVIKGTGTNFILIPDVNDGEAGSDQAISFSATSSDNSVLEVNNVSFQAGNTFAIIEVIEKGLLDSVTIIITADDGDSIVNDSLKVFVTSYNYPGIQWSVYDLAPWLRKIPDEFDVSVFDTTLMQFDVPYNELNFDKLGLTKYNEFYTNRIKGYLVPPVTGTYQFYLKANAVSQFWMSDDANHDNAVMLMEDWWETPDPVVTKDLIAGKVYAILGVEWIVHNGSIEVQWVGPGIPKQYIPGKYMMPMYDSIAPSIPKNFTLLTKGSKDIRLAWEPSTDNYIIEGYNIYLDGKLYNNIPFKDTLIMITGLTSETNYSVVVTSVDPLGNESALSDIITLTTYPIETIPPNVPTNIQTLVQTGLAIKVGWDNATDGETAIRGYNIYVDDVLYDSTDYIYNNYTIIKNLNPETAYNITVSAVDINYNESAKSPVFIATTGKFDPQGPDLGVYRGTISLSMIPITKNYGFGINVGYGENEILKSNVVPYSGFEFPIDYNRLSFFNKSLNGIILQSETSDPYKGKKSAKLSGGINAKLTCALNKAIYPEYEYEVRIALKVDNNYLGNDVNVNIVKRFGGNYHSVSFTPTTSWAEYTSSFTVANPTDDVVGIEIEIPVTSIGYVYVDNVEFYVKNFYDGSKYTTKAMNLLRDLDPGGVRWGGINANYEDFGEHSGDDAWTEFTYADWMNLNNQLDAYTIISVGVKNGSYDMNGDGDTDDPGDNYTVDWISSGQTFSNFIEYLAGPPSSVWGAVRAAEGYINPLLNDSKGLIIEFGNEVWGKDVHGAEIGSNYPDYGQWCREMARIMKSSPYYDNTKIMLSYSGRNANPAESYGLNEDVIFGDTGEVELLSVSGYIHGNLDYDVAIDHGESELDFYKNSIETAFEKLMGMDEQRKDFFEFTGQMKNMYMYEGNFTTNSYHGRLGEAIVLTDYYSCAIEKGVILPSVFSFSGSQWKILADDRNFEKLPLFHTSALFNNYCKGIVLKTELNTQYFIYDSDENQLDGDPISCHAYTNDTSYSILMLSRDFEHDYTIQIDLPDTLTYYNNAKIYTISGNDFSTKTTIIDTVSITLSDSILVKLPKYSMVLISFSGVNQNMDLPLGYTDYKKIESVEIIPENGIPEMTENGGFIILNANVLPADAFVKIVKWEVVNNDINAVTGDFTDGYIIQGSRICNGNGTVTVRATAIDNDSVYDEITITVSGQENVGGCNTSISEENNVCVSIYPNPASEFITVSLKNTEIKNISIVNLAGSKVFEKSNIFTPEFSLGISNLKSGIYFLQIESEHSVETIKFVKE